ncbi:hypothetical protein LTR84_006619 [Exophiala bonariae]|uniref:Dihydrolipoamide acetyltransferase component of pyruvate dehydrogenase complex n=1 Tax=Exophiala bonariae TaxID=1690606 RepID=A0AAV9N3A2_9EURO|nr:hypothetical protein LTR84_006619 [Exophiala bonariae]
MALQKVLPRIAPRQLGQCFISGRSTQPVHQCSRLFHQSAPLKVVKPYILADIGEGITECQIISWSVKPGDKVEQFDTICEVSSDKATVEITSRFDGVIKKLYYEQDDVAVVGKALLDIDIEGDDEISTETQVTESELEVSAATGEPGKAQDTTTIQAVETIQQSQGSSATSNQPSAPPASSSDFAATPAVRHLLKQHNLSAANIVGTGKGGRISKEDVERHITGLGQDHPAPAPISSQVTATPKSEGDVSIRFSPTENQMFKAMTRSLSIPHFLYAHTVDVSSFQEVRTKLASSKVLEHLATSAGNTSTAPKVTLLPFILKALSRVFTKFPKLNSHMDASDPSTPRLTLKGSHNFGIAIDTPQGLLVPVIKNVQNHSVLSLAAEVKRISEIARAGKLRPEDFQGATFTVSNIGSVGAGCQVVSPVIVSPMVGILGMGRMSDVPVFRKDDDGIERLVKEQQVILSWSADHRIIDGATVAKAADMLAALLSRPESLGLILT